MESPGGLPFFAEASARKLAEVRHHDDIAAALLLYLGTRYTRVAMFKVADGRSSAGPQHMTGSRRRI